MKPLNPLVKKGMELACQAFLLERLATFDFTGKGSKEFEEFMRDTLFTLTKELVSAFGEASEKLEQKLSDKVKNIVVDESLRSPKIASPEAK